MSKIKLLYVDDESINIKLFSLNFKKLYDLYSAISGAEGLKIIESVTIDVIVSDYKMPKMNGLEFLSKAKELNPNIKCFLVSAYMEAEIRHLTLGSTILEGYISKPWKRQNLIDLIAESVT